MTQVVIVDQTHKIDAALLQNAAISLNTQVTKDLASCWNGISANVSVSPSLAAVPHGAWPVFLVKSLPPGEGGFHLDKHNQPYSKVIASPDDNSWTLDASHEIIEMLIDPSGNRMHTSQAIRISGNDVVDGTGVFNYLVEACDPCEANNFGYDINGIAVSDFITPHYYDSSPTPGARYSFKGHITRPRQLLPGGYISYVQPDGNWNQILWLNKRPEYKVPEIADGARSMRLAIHESMGPDLNREKHQERRKKNGLPKDVRARISQMGAPAKKNRESYLRGLYELA